MRTTLLLIVSILTGFVLSCKTESKPEPAEKPGHVFIKHYVRYLQTEKELRAEVSFKKGDTLANARPIFLNSVRFEGEKMPIQNLGKSHGVRYAVRKKSPHKEAYEFSYQDEQLKLPNYTISMSPIADFSIKDNIISKKSGMTLLWEGAPLDKNQELILLFADEKNKALPVQVKGPTSGSELVIAPEKITNLSLGKGKLMLIKKQFQQFQENKVTNISEMEFYSDNQEIDIRE